MQELNAHLSSLFGEVLQRIVAHDPSVVRLDALTVELVEGDRLVALHTGVLERKVEVGGH